METNTATTGRGEGMPEATVRWTGRQRVGFADVDQEGRIKFSSIVRYVMAGYEGLFPQLGTSSSRAEYFANHGLQPITTYAELERAPRRAALDVDVDLTYRATLGFELGKDGAPRYGGHDEIQLACADGEPLALWRQHWLWVSQDRGALLDRPAPAVTAVQSAELPSPPRPPAVDPQDAAVGRFRWALRETDVNHHVNLAAYLERVENALADADLDSVPPDRASVWFRRASFAGESMTTAIVEQEGSFVVRLSRQTSDELCATVLLSRTA